MHRNKIVGALIAAALATGTVAVGQLPALAAAADTTPTITAAATSNLPTVNGAVWVAFRYPVKKYSQAQISGNVANAAAGNVVRLYAKQFGQHSPTEVDSPITLNPTGTTTPYSFSVTPAIATSYTVELFATSSDTTPLASATPVAVWVVATHEFGRFSRCRHRPTCHVNTHLRVLVPASALKTERSKRWFVYFGIRFSPTGTVPPKTLKLGAGHPHVSAPQKINSHEYAVTITISFFVGNHGWFLEIWPCQRDTEAKDGVGLPGRHGCGTLRQISAKRIYLG